MDPVRIQVLNPQLMGKKKDRKLRKDNNKEDVTSLLENEGLKDDCLEDVELTNQGVNDEFKDGHKRKKNKRKVVEVNDIDEECLKGKKMPRRREGNDTKVISQEAGFGKEQNLERRVSDENKGGSNSGNREKRKKYAKEKEDALDVGWNGGVDSEMNGGRKVRKRKRKREKLNDDVVCDDVSDGKERHSPSTEKESKVKEKNHRCDLFTGNENESYASKCKERKRVSDTDSDGNKQVADTDMGEDGKKMKIKKIHAGNKLGSEGRNGCDTMETRLDMEASDCIPYITTEGHSKKDVANSELRKNGKIKKKKKKKSLIEWAEVKADKHLPEGKECSEELTAEGKSMQVVESSKMGGNGKKIKNKKRKMNKVNKLVSEGKECNEVSKYGKGTETSDHSSIHKSPKKSKRVSFSDEVEVLDLVRGKRFTKEEDEKIIGSVHSYIRSHGLGDDGVEMILNCSSYPEVKNCWKEIVKVLPHRPRRSVYYRAHSLLERAEERKWTRDECEHIRRFYDNHGGDWKTLADGLGKHRKHVRDCWRRIKFEGDKRCWSQDDYQTLFDLVNQDLRMRALEKNRESRHGMLRDNIPWEAISEILSRTNTYCWRKWYQQLTSPMVGEGNWSDTDDYRLVSALYELDACSMEEVEWDFLLEHRTGYICRKRWYQMVRHIGNPGNKSFAEQVEILSKRYCPHLVEDREAFDSKPVVN